MSDTAANASLKWDLSQPEFDPADCPAWARVAVPVWVEPYRGANGLTEPWQSIKAPLATNTRGIDRYQANQFIFHRPETAAYLYSEYTPVDVGYVAGTLPAHERLVAEYIKPGMSDLEKAQVLMSEAMPRLMLHPTMPPLGERVPASRNLTDDQLLTVGSGWCNEQARLYSRLCQVLGMQGRVIHLFGQHHTVAEVYVDGRWLLADATWFFLALDQSGQPLSAADCHDRAAGQLAYAKAKKARFEAMLQMSDAELNFPDGEQAERSRKSWREYDPEAIARETLDFGVINNPLPPAPAAAER